MLFHVHNEYGAPVSACHCDAVAARLPRLAAGRYGDLERAQRGLGNGVLGPDTTATCDEVRTPAAAVTVVNPAQQLDFARFSDDELRACYTAERDILKRHAPDIPVTTNFMATSCPSVDYWKWAREVDIVSNDHYLTAERADAHIGLAMAADLTRSVAGGRPWILMEHSTSAVNWQAAQPRQGPRRDGQRNSLTHVARGADGVLFFQWRASRRGAEKFHSAMLPHGGTGHPGLPRGRRPRRGPAAAGRGPGLTGGRRTSRCCGTGSRLGAGPRVATQCRPRPPRAHRGVLRDALATTGVTVDFVHPGDDLSAYRLVIAPQTYLISTPGRKNLDDFVRAGGHLLVSYFSGVVDETDAVHAEGLSGPPRRTLGLIVEEFAPLRSGDQVAVRWSGDGSDIVHPADVWTDRLVPEPGTEVMATFLDGPAAGGPAVTRRRLGPGTAWYVATRPDQAGLAKLVRQVCDEAGVERGSSGSGLEVVTRVAGDTSYVFAINHSDRDGDLAVTGTELLTGRPAEGRVIVPAGAVRVIRTP